MGRNPRIDKLVGEHAEKLSARLMAHRAQLFPPNARKELRKFTSGEVADLLGVKDAYLRKLSLEGRGPQPETGTGGRRLYTPSDIVALRKLGGLGWKGRLAVGWSTGRAVLGGLEVEDGQGTRWAFTAVRGRDALFARLVAIGGQRWARL